MFAKHGMFLSSHFLANQIYYYSNIRSVTTTPHSLQVICPKGVEPKAWRFFWANPDLVNYLGNPRFRNWSRRKPNSEQLSQETLQDRWRTCTPRNLWRTGIKLERLHRRLYISHFVFKIYPTLQGVSCHETLLPISRITHSTFSSVPVIELPDGTNIQGWEVLKHFLVKNKTGKD